MNNQIRCNGKPYVIKEGDTLYKISRKEKIPLEWILHANPYVDVYNLQIGEKICLPGRKPVPGNPPYIVVPEDFEDAFILVDYVIKEGDTLEQLLERFDVDLEDLLKYNGMHAITLKTGNILKIPREIDD